MPGFKTNTHDLNQIFFIILLKIPFQTEAAFRNVSNKCKQALRPDNLYPGQIPAEVFIIFYLLSRFQWHFPLLVFPLNFHPGAVWLRVGGMLRKCLSTGRAFPRTWSSAVPAGSDAAVRPMLQEPAWLLPLGFNTGQKKPTWCVKNGTKELVKRGGATHGFAGETSLFLLVPEDVSSELSTQRGREAGPVLGNTWQSIC